MIAARENHVVRDWYSGAVRRRTSGPECTRLDSPRRTNMVVGVTYKVAECRREREAAFRLVYDAYREAGLIPENPQRQRVTEYHLLPTTAVFLAIYDGKPIYTASLVPDDALGVPLDSLYHDEVEAMRAQGHYPAEVTCLAGRRKLFERREQFNTLVNLMGLTIQYARKNSVDRLMVAVHPRHAKFYQHFFGFEVFGELKSYAAIRGNPAVGCVHDFAKTDVTGYPLRDKVYGVTYASWELVNQPLSSAECSYFGEAAQSAGHELVPMAA